MIKNAFILFGATGDLAQRKIYPALEELKNQHQLGEDLFLVGSSRREWDSVKYQKFIKDSLLKFSESPQHNQFYEKIKIDFARIEFGSTKLYDELAIKLNDYKIEKQIFIYLAIEPRFYRQVISEIFNSEIFQKFSEKLVFLVEKPFGQDYQSAQQLNELLRSNIPKERIIRVDHVVNRDIILELTEFRRLNPGFNQLFSNQFIQEVQVSYPEKLGVESRPEFYDETGALKDMVQSHLLQILQSTLKPLSQENSIINTFSLLDKTNPINSIIRGQYEGYNLIEGVPKQSQTETYTALALKSDHELWRGVPIYLRTGKKLNQKYLDINLILKHNQDFLGENVADNSIPNLINIRVYPNPAINFVMRRRSIKTQASAPIENITLNHCYQEKNLSDAYTNMFRLLFQNKLADINQNSDSDIYSSWKLIDQITGFFPQTKLEIYPINSQGPNSANEMLNKNNSRWISTNKIQQCIVMS